MAPVVIAGLDKTFRHQGKQIHALRDVNFDIQSGEVLVLLGASGSGKSTLLRCVAGLERPSRGRIVIGNRVVCDTASGIDVATHRRNVGMVFQSYALWPHMSVRDNVGYPLRVRWTNARQAREKVDEVLDIVGCLPLADRLPSRLSGGQQQRVALARALVAQPSVMLFDEPLSNLDALLRRDLRRQIKRLHQAIGFTALYVTHDQGEALYLGHRVAVVRDGAVEQIGSPEVVHRLPRTESLAAFLGVRNRLALDENTNRPLLSSLHQRMPSRVGDLAGAIAYIRSENLELSLEPFPDDGAYAAIGVARISQVSYAGEWMECDLLMDGQELNALIRHGLVLDGEGPVHVGCRLEHVLLYKNGERVYPSGLG